MSTLITLGCSFSQGQGCYNKNSIYNSDRNSQEYYNDSLDSFLSGSIGSIIQKRFGYEKFYNYALAADSNLGQLLNFFKHPIDEDDVVILWQVTFYHRDFAVIENKMSGLPMDDEWVKLKLKHRINFNVTSSENDMRTECYHYLNVIKEYCRVRGWKFFVWFWENGEYNIMNDLFEDLRENIIPFNKEPFVSGSFCWEGHPNEIGYTQLANGLIKSIETHNIPFPIPNEIPSITKRIKSEHETHIF